MDYTADIYSLETPGEFKVVYRDATGKSLEEAPLTGVSTYRQREGEILDRLKQLHSGVPPEKLPDLGDAGEY